MTTTVAATFDQSDMAATLDALSDTELDALPFGVIGFTTDTCVSRYNSYESACAGLSRERVVSHPLFEVVAPCMNNFMVAQRFEDALAAGEALDTSLDYVLTLRMRPTKVKLRLLSSPGAAVRYVLVARRA